MFNGYVKAGDAGSQELKEYEPVDKTKAAGFDGCANSDDDIAIINAKKTKNLRIATPKKVEDKLNKLLIC